MKEMHSSVTSFMTFFRAILSSLFLPFWRPCGHVTQDFNLVASIRYKRWDSKDGDKAGYRSTCVNFASYIFYLLSP